MDNIKDIVSQVIQQISVNKPENQRRVESLFRDFLEDKYLKHIRVSGVKNNTVVVFVDSSVWIYQMNIVKQKLLEHINQEIPEIQSIRFRIGKVQ